MLEHTLELDASNMEAQISALPARAGVLSIAFASAGAQPYVTHTADIRRRARRLLEAATVSEKRLSLRAQASRISWTCTASQLETLLLLFRLLPDPARRLKLRPPPLLHFHRDNAYPRTTVTRRFSFRKLECYYGPMASRASAENYLDATLDLFLLRRCQPDLDPDPAFPGCVYSEMHKCLAPCFAGCTDERYAEEAVAVRAFLDTRGASLVAQIEADRDAASAEMEFERAATLHAKLEKVKAAVSLAPPLAVPLNALRAIIIERSDAPDTVRLFLFSGLCFAASENFSTLGMRHANEQASSSSLFAQPMHLAAVPLEQAALQPEASPEQRLQELLASLETQASQQKAPNMETATAHLAMLRRWFYRPDAKKTGEIFLAPPGTPWPMRRILRAVSRVYLGRTAQPAAPQHSVPA